MNYLAHAYLSFGDAEILVGNMISDFVKGKRKFNYSQGIQDGIALHRSIDSFTDSHNATREAKQFLKPAVGLYAAAFVDIIYDHFLANDKNEFTSERLKTFAAATYGVLYEYKSIIPERFAGMLPYMSSQDWLYNYKTIQGIERSFGGLARRAMYLQSSDEAFKVFNYKYDSFKQCYENFFPFLKKFVLEQFNILRQNS